MESERIRKRAEVREAYYELEDIGKLVGMENLIRKNNALVSHIFLDFFESKKAKNEVRKFALQLLEKLREDFDN